MGDQNNIKEWSPDDPENPESWAKASAPKWETIESDPEIFWGLTRAIGAQKLDFVEIYDLDDHAIGPGSLGNAEQEYGKILGLVFLLRWHRDILQSLKSAGEVRKDCPCEEVFFTRQVADNSCATIALLNLIFNLSSEDVELGPELKAMAEHCSGLPVEYRGIDLACSTFLNTHHNNSTNRSFAEFSLEDEDNDQDGASFHYVSFVPKNDALYLLDGLSMWGPLKVEGSTGCGQNWAPLALKVIRNAIEALQSAAPNDIRFNLIAMVPDPAIKINKEISDTQEVIACHLKRLRYLAKNGDSEATSDEQAGIKRCLEQTERCRLRLKELTDRDNERWRARKIMSADMAPFVLGAMRMLAQKRKLSGAYQRVAEGKR